MSYTANYLELLSEAAKKTAPATAPAAAPVTLRKRPDFIKPIPKKTGDDGYEKIREIIKLSSNTDISYTDDGLVECSYKDIERVLSILDKGKTKRGMGYSSIIYGEAGIGKSAVIEKRARTIAGELGREFIQIDEFIRQYETIQEVQSALKNYYIFIDQRVASMDPTMMTGIPDPTSIEKKGYLTEMPLPWVALMTMSNDAAGFLFLDELNMAGEEVQKALYSLLNFEERRIAGQYMVRGNWRIHSAGNWGEGYDSNPLRLALKERLAPYYLKIDFNGWAKWAKSTTNDQGQPIIHPLLMDFIEDDPTNNFYDRPSENHDSTKRPNPRNFVALSSSLYEILGNSGDLENIEPDSDTWDDILMQTSSICGKKFGAEFRQYLMSNAIIKMEDIFDNPASLLPGQAGKESEVVQRIAVFKRNIKKHVATFDDKFNASDEAGRDNLTNLALNYIDVIDAIYDVDQATAMNLFGPIISSNMMNDFKIFKSLVVSHAAATIPGGAEYVDDFFNKIKNEIGGYSAAFKGGPTSYATEENEETSGSIVDHLHSLPPEKLEKINKVLQDFGNRLRTGNLIEFLPTA